MDVFLWFKLTLWWYPFTFSMAWVDYFSEHWLCSVRCGWFCWFSSEKLILFQCLTLKLATWNDSAAMNNNPTLLKVCPSVLLILFTKSCVIHRKDIYHIHWWTWSLDLQLYSMFIAWQLAYYRFVLEGYLQYIFVLLHSFGPTYFKMIGKTPGLSVKHYLGNLFWHNVM